MKTEKSMSWHHHCIFVYVCFTPTHPIWVGYEKRRVVMIEFTVLIFFLNKRRKKKVNHNFFQFLMNLLYFLSEKRECGSD